MFLILGTVHLVPCLLVSQELAIGQAFCWSVFKDHGIGMEELDHDILRSAREAIFRGSTHADIARYLQLRFPNSRGLSSRSVRRYFKRNNISRINNHELDEVVAHSVVEVGPIYGRRLMTGYLHAQGLTVNRDRVARSMERVDPVSYEQRRTNAANRTNPALYTANYYGHKIHLDQNEKLAMFGVTHVCARDGYSGRIVGMITIPRKCNMEIVDKLFRPLLIREGVWTQVRVDQGTEFVLTTFIQDCLAGYRPEQNCPPWVATSSVHNLRIERIWPEVNHRVNYPLKRIAVRMHEQGLIHMDDDIEKFCVSMVLIQTARIGARRFVTSWNNHTLPTSAGRPGAFGTPEDCYQRNCRTTPLGHLQIPTTEELINLYQDRGGRIVSFGRFGWDPLADDAQLVQERQQRMELNFPSYEYCFNAALIGYQQPLQQTILGCIRTTLDIVNAM